MLLTVAQAVLRCSHSLGEEREGVAANLLLVPGLTKEKVQAFQLKIRQGWEAERKEK